jgi:hypothetical protein
MKPNGRAEPETDVHLKFDGHPTQQSADKIRQFDQIPDIMTMEIPPVEWLVDGMIARNTITLWTGTDGTAKTFLAQKMAIAVATGGTFLGRMCQPAPVLYLDYENPVFAIRERLDLMAGGPNDLLRVWGTWLEQQPPQIGSELLFAIAKETKPLIIIDPFLYAHGFDENSSTEMAGVMQCLRHYSAAGGAVILIHHPAKTEGSTGRGSSAIKGAADVAFLQEMSDETGLITLKCVKNRFGERHTITIRADYDEGSFTVTDSPQFTKRADEIEKLRKLIEENPGLTQNALSKKSGMMKNRLVKLLKENPAQLWREEKDGQAFRYFPPVLKAKNFSGPENRLFTENRSRTGGNQSDEKSEHKLFSQDRTGQEQVVPVLCSPPLIGENKEQPGPESQPAGLTSCRTCGSFAIHKPQKGKQSA